MSKFWYEFTYVSRLYPFLMESTPLLYHTMHEEKIHYNYRVYHIDFTYNYILKRRSCHPSTNNRIIKLFLNIHNNISSNKYYQPMKNTLSINKTLKPTKKLKNTLDFIEHENELHRYTPLTLHAHWILLLRLASWLSMGRSR